MLGYWLSNALGHIVGVTYPMYASFKALESPAPEDDQQWLTYWIVWAAFTTAEYFAGMVFAFFPFYYELKLAFVIYLMAPQTQGALAIYRAYVRPYLKSHEEGIDQHLADATAAGKRKISEVAPTLIAAATNGIAQVASMASNSGSHSDSVASAPAAVECDASSDKKTS